MSPDRLPSRAEGMSFDQRRPFCTAVPPEPVALVTTEAGRIASWNVEAERLFGHPASAVRGRSLHEALQSRDAFGNRITCDCGVREMLRRGEHVWRQVVTATTAAGDSFRVVLTVRPALPGTPITWEIRLDARKQGGDRRAADRSRRFPAGLGTLSPSELKVLRLLAAGQRAQQVADALSVSVTTVRHHIQNVLKKLDVHTQVEAVSIALQSGVL